MRLTVTVHANVAVDAVVAPVSVGGGKPAMPQSEGAGDLSDAIIDCKVSVVRPPRCH